MDNVLPFPPRDLASRRRSIVADLWRGEQAGFCVSAPDPEDRDLVRWSRLLLDRPLLELTTGRHGRATELRRFGRELFAKFWTRDRRDGGTERFDWVEAKLLSPHPMPPGDAA